MTIPKLHYTNSDMVQDLNSMYRAMHLNGYTPDVILGITRGGLIPSVYMSHYFNKDLITIKVSFRDSNVLESLDQVIQLIKEGKTILAVDDICDSGETLEWIYEGLFAAVPEQIENFKTAVLIHNEGCRKFTPDYTGTLINKSERDVWVCFPWEQ